MSHVNMTPLQPVWWHTMAPTEDIIALPSTRVVDGVQRFNSWFPLEWLRTGQESVHSPIFSVRKGSGGVLPIVNDGQALDDDFDILQVHARKTTVKCGPDPALKVEDQERVVREALKQAEEMELRYIYAVSERKSSTGKIDRYTVDVIGAREKANG